MLMEENPDISTNVENWTEDFFLIFHLLISDDCSYWKNRALKVFECLELQKWCFPFVVLSRNWTVVMKTRK